MNAAERRARKMAQVKVLRGLLEEAKIDGDTEERLRLLGIIHTYEADLDIMPVEMVDSEWLRVMNGSN